MDRIVLTGMRFESRLGVTDEERELPQLVEVDLELEASLAAAAASDDIADAIDYVPIVERRARMAYGDRERDFQLYRRGRYAEFNLAFDRGTRYGLQAQARAESVLASLPPLVKWVYDWAPEPGSPEARLETDFLPPREWLG